MTNALRWREPRWGVATPITWKQSMVAILAAGWRAEIMIPWDDVGARPIVGDAWGFNLGREERPTEEYLCWSPTWGPFNRIHQWGEIIFADIDGSDVEDAQMVIKQKHDKVGGMLAKGLDPSVALMVNAKTRGHAIWREEWVCQARSNAVNTVWGKAIAGRILEVADYWTARSDKELLDLVPVGNPRALTPGQYYGDPISGGNRTALVTCMETPYRWYNPTTKKWWYDGVTVTNPGTGEKLVVEDDGSGFVAPEGFPRPGMRTYFTAAYRGYLIGMLLADPYAPTAGPDILPRSSGLRYHGAIPRLAEAYALTGNPTYARKAAILLGRLAELYPYMNGHMDDDPRYVISGRAVWLEKTTTDSEWLYPFMDAVDLVWNAADADMERQLAKLFAAVPGPDGTKRQEPFRFKQTLNDMMPYAAQLCEKCRLDIGADWCFRWINAEIAVAACTESPKLMANVLLGPCPALQGLLRESFCRDGRYSCYDSVDYLIGLARSFLTLPFRCVGFQGGSEFPNPLNLYADPRFLLDEIIASNFKTETSALRPTFGDGDPGRNPRPPSETRLAGHPPYIPSMETPAWMCLMPFMEAPAAFSEKFRAMFQTSLRGRSVELDRLRETGGDFLTLAFARPLAEPAVPTGTAAMASSLLEDSAIAFLRCGQALRTRHDLVMWGAPSGAHAHGDKLGIWFGGRGRHLAAAGGAYPFTWMDSKLGDWEQHSAACWVVLVDGASQNPSYSDLLAFYAGDLFRHCAMVNTNAYPDSRQQRNIWLIPGPNDGDAYAVDIFQVAGGGKCFDYNTRGNDAGRFEDICFDFQGGTPAWEPHSGTLAGTNVALYSAPGYGWMKDVRMTTTARDFAWQYDYGGAGLKVHALSFGHSRTLIYALGEVGGFARGKSPWDPHILWRDEAPEASNHVTQFVTVLESVGAAPFLKTIQTLACTEPATGIHPVGLKLTHGSGHTDVMLINPQPGRKICFNDTAGARWATDAHTAMQRFDPSGRVMRVELFDGTFLKTPQGEYACPGSLEGTVETVDYARREIVVRLAAPASSNIPPQALADMVVGILYPASGGRLSAYRIRNVRLAGTRFSFVSPVSLIHSEAPPAFIKFGLANRPVREIAKRKVVVDIAPGDRFRLPLSSLFH